MLKKYVYLSFVLLFTLVLIAPSTYAARPVNGGGSKPGSGGSTTSTIGYDISYPQCGKTITTGAFGIVGVNDGYATGGNPCFAQQLKWAHGSTGAATGQVKAQVYVNTANPGEVLEQYSVDTWPTNNIDIRGNDSLNNPDPALRNPYGACRTNPENYKGYVNDKACSWQYGWNRSVETVDNFFKPGVTTAGLQTKVTDYVWWLDVETMNSWQEEYDADGKQDTEGLARNTATLEAMKAFYVSEGVKTVGIYSTGYQWGRITGKTVENGQVGQNLRGVPSWLAGAMNEKDARKRCTASSALTPGGKVSLVQYVSKNLDHNVSCL